MKINQKSDFVTKTNFDPIKKLEFSLFISNNGVIEEIQPCKKFDHLEKAVQERYALLESTAFMDADIRIREEQYKVSWWKFM